MEADGCDASPAQRAADAHAAAHSERTKTRLTEDVIAGQTVWAEEDVQTHGAGEVLRVPQLLLLQRAAHTFSLDKREAAIVTDPLLHP